MHQVIEQARHDSIAWLVGLVHVPQCWCLRLVLPGVTMSSTATTLRVAGVWWAVCCSGTVVDSHVLC